MKRYYNEKVERGTEGRMMALATRSNVGKLGPLAGEENTMPGLYEGSADV